MLMAPGGAALLAGAWRSSSMSSRLGLMMVVQEALDLSPGCLESCEEDLVTVLFSGDTSLRGDTLDILSRIGTSTSLPAIRQCLLDMNPDVAEMAAEAIALITARSEGGR